MLDQNSVITFDTDDKKEISDKLKELFEYENTLEKNSSVKLDLKGKDLDTIAFVLREAMNNNELKNTQLILNIVCMLKSYFTFDQSFFESPDIYVNNTISLVDLKELLHDDIERMSYRLGIYFISICKSLNKVEYTMLDTYTQLPSLYHTLMLTLDMITISSILCNIKGGSFEECSLVRDANLYFNEIAHKYCVGNALMNEFLDKVMKSEGTNNENISKL